MKAFHPVAITPTLPRCSNASFSRCCYSPYNSLGITSVFKCKHSRCYYSPYNSLCITSVFRCKHFTLLRLPLHYTSVFERKHFILLRLPLHYLGIRMQAFHAVTIPPTVPSVLPRCSNASISRCYYSPYITSVFKCKLFTLLRFPLHYLGVQMQAFHAVALAPKDP